jgi:aryl-alcohol dehydrogenase-like predicted oxidoreductase
MQRIILGRSGLDVPVMAVGTHPLAQRAPEVGARVLRRAFELGATWWDTSDDYGSFPVVARAMAGRPREALTISSKSYVTGYAEGQAAVREALEALGTPYLDLMFLHYVQSAEELEARAGCLEAFREAKQAGRVRAIALSSHTATGLRAALAVPDIEVVMAPWNIRGRLPDSATLPEMSHALQACYEAGKGVVLIKVLGAGVLFTIFDDAIRGAARFPYKHVLNIGVQSVRELEADLRLVLGQTVDPNIIRQFREGGPWGKAA